MKKYVTKPVPVQIWKVLISDIKWKSAPDWVFDLIKGGHLITDEMKGCIHMELNGSIRSIFEGHYIMQISGGIYKHLKPYEFAANYLEVRREDTVDFEYDTGRVIEKAPPIKDLISNFEMIDHPDGTATVAMDVSPETLKLFAGIGILKVLVDTAKEEIEKNEFYKDN